MPKRFSRTRPRHPRQEKPIFVIAAEGEVTEKIYFEKIREKFREKYVIHILSGDSRGNSAPKHVIQRLEEFIKKKVSTRRKNDEFWAVLDCDSWGEKQLMEAFDKCEDKNFGFAVSNPCFELWLNLHQKTPKCPKNCRDYEKELTKLLNKQYKKNDYDAGKLIAEVLKAIENAENLHQDKSEPYPKDTGTHVYLLIEKIVNK